MKIPVDWDEVTPEWMSAMLSHRFPGATVATVELIWHTDGTNRRARFQLTYSSGAGPGVVFVKAEGKFREVHAQNGNMFNEPLLFASGVPLPVDHPECYATLINQPGLDWLIVMEDVDRRGAETREATMPMTSLQVTDGVGGLARLHRQYWGFSGDSVPALDWVQTWEATDGFLSAIRSRIERGIERMKGTLPPALIYLSGNNLVDLCARYMTLLADDPVTLLHGDAHIGNTYVLPNDTVGFLDWQVARRGNWSSDVGYFVIGALTESDRREHERDILESYRIQLDRGISAEEAWTWYRASPLYGLPVWLATLGSEGAQAVPISMTLSQRYGTAVVELDALSALEELERGE